jgi:hypothetical protein
LQGVEKEGFMAILEGARGFEMGDQAQSQWMGAPVHAPVRAGCDDRNKQSSHCVWWLQLRCEEA